MKIEITQENGIEAFNNEWFKSATDQEILAAWIYTGRVVCPFDIFDGAYHRVMGDGYWNTDLLSKNFCQKVIKVIGKDVVKSKDDLARILRIEL